MFGNKIDPWETSNIIIDYECLMTFEYTRNQIPNESCDK